MKINSISRFFIFFVLAGLPMFPSSETYAENPGHGSKMSVVRVNITRQGFNFTRPWQRESPSAHTAIGVIIEKKRILVTARLVANHRYIEVEDIETGEKSAAELVIVDYEANLAMLAASDPDFLEDAVPLEIATDAAPGDTLSVWQVKPNGDITPSSGPITAVELGRYNYGNSFLVYRMNHSLQYRFGNTTLPAVKDGKLAGLLMRHDSRGQTTDVIAAPVIKHFLKDAEDGDYRGFPRTGIFYVPTEDPQLRRYVKLGDRTGGVYAEGLVRGGPAEKAGVREGDVVLKIAGYDVDNRGNYEHPLYGKVGLSHLIRCEFHAGDSVPHVIFRDGNETTLNIVPERREPENWLVPPYRIDKPPKYIIIGGLIVQELTISHLREYGSNWSLKAPTELVHYARNQDSIDPEGRKKIVFLSSVLPTSYTIGYEDLSNIIITKINGRFISDLDDVTKATGTPVDGFHKIELDRDPRMIFLDAANLPEIDKQIKERYGLKKLQNLL